MQTAQQLINGQARIGQAINPATGEVAAHFADGGASRRGGRAEGL